MKRENVRESYESPRCEMIEIQCESMLCESFGSDNESYREDDWSGIF